MTTSTTTSRGSIQLTRYIRGSQVVSSSELIRLLQHDGLTEDNARQFIRRQAKANGIWRSEKLKLARGERLFADSTLVGKPEFFVAIGDKLRQTSRYGLVRCLDAIAKLHVLNKIDLLRLLAVSPLVPSTNKSLTSRLYASELAALKELGVRVIYEGTPLESLVSPAFPTDDNADKIAAFAAGRLRNEALLARVLVERLRRQNMVSWNRVEMPDPEVPFTTFNAQVFSAYGFSYLSPLTRWKQGEARPKPCPVLIDCYHEICTLSQVESFLQRIERATIRGKSRLQVLGIIAARDFERDAWTYARKKGFITVSFRQIFGDEALEAMVLVEKLFNGLKRGHDVEAEQQFQQFSGLLKQLKTNPIVVTLRSIGFEALGGLILGAQGYGQVALGRIVPRENTTRDVDVFGIRDDELRVIECKAYHCKKSLPPEEVRKFFTQTLPALKAWLQRNNHSFKRCIGEIWTTGPKGKEAGDELYALHRPKNHEWHIRRMKDIEEIIPSSIKIRSVELLRSISVTEEDDSEETDQ